jgi:hypothetical protein
LHLVATCAAPNASCGVKPQAARGSGAEPEAAAAVIYVRTNPGRDKSRRRWAQRQPSGSGFRAESQAGWFEQQGRYNCFLTGHKREKPAWPERLKTKSLPGPAAVLAEGQRHKFWTPYKNKVFGD